MALLNFFDPSPDWSSRGVIEGGCSKKPAFGFFKNPFDKKLLHKKIRPSAGPVIFERGSFRGVEGSNRTFLTSCPGSGTGKKCPQREN